MDDLSGLLLCSGGAHPGSEPSRVGRFQPVQHQECYGYLRQARNSRSSSSARFAHSREKQVSRSTKCRADNVPIVKIPAKTRQIDIDRATID